MNSKIKTLLTVVLIVCMALLISCSGASNNSSAPPSNNGGTVHPDSSGSKGLEFTSLNDGSCMVSGIGTCTDSDLVIPSKSPKGEAVTKIGGSAFWNCDILKSVVIPEGVVSINAHAFGDCSNLTSIVIPDSVTKIGNDAFEFCSNLKTVKMSKNVKQIGDYAFENCYLLTSVELPNTLEAIGYEAFSDCYNLASITLPKSLSSMGNRAFANCYKLVEVINRSDLVVEKGTYDCGNVGYFALEIHSGDSKMVSKDGYLFYTVDNENYLVGYTGNEQDITLPANYNGEDYNINRYAFFYDVNILSVTVQSGVTSIGQEAFVCPNLARFILDDTVGRISISNGAFYCQKLIEIVNNSEMTFVKGESYYGRIAQWAKEIHTGESKMVTQNGYTFYSCDSANYLLGYFGNETNLVLPADYNGEKYEIYANAFYENSDIVSVKIPDSVTLIGEQAFYSCDKLSSVTVGNSVTSIENSCFQYCRKLENLELGKAITNIGKAAFDDCELITEIDLPSGLTTIGVEAFSGCKGLKTITIPEGVTVIDKSTFNNCKFTTVNLPKSIVKIGEYGLSIATSETVNIYFSGTIAQWEAIEKHPDWNFRNEDCIVHCTDGDIK